VKGLGLITRLPALVPGRREAANPESVTINVVFAPPRFIVMMAAMDSGTPIAGTIQDGCP
jgi:hypothetical protein